MMPDGNPFSTRCVQPGALTYLFPPGEDAGVLVDRLRRSGWWGQVTGPHGVGKTTLLHTLRGLLQQAGRDVEWVTLRRGQGRMPHQLRDQWHGWDSRILVIVDGYEQLARWARWQLKWRCRRSGAGLLVTSHKNVGLPRIHRIQPSLPVFRKLVAQLLRGYPSVLRDSEITHYFQMWNGNVREVLFALYDVYERRCRELN